MVTFEALIVIVVVSGSSLLLALLRTILDLMFLKSWAGVIASPDPDLASERACEFGLALP